MMIKYKLKRLAALCLAVIISAAAFSGISSVSDSEAPLPKAAVLASADDEDENAELDRQLSELDKQKKELDEKIKKAGDDISAQQEKLDAVEKKAAVIKKKIKKTTEKSLILEDEMVELDDKMRETRYNLEQSESEIQKDISEFKERLRIMYIAGNSTYSDVLVNAESFYDILMRVELVKRVAQHDNELIDRLLEEKAEIEAYQAALERQSKSLKEKSAEYSEQQKSLAEQQSELLQLKQEYGDKIKSLQGDLDSYIDQFGIVSDEYDRTWDAAQTTTVTTEPPPETTAETSAETSKTTKKTTTKKTETADPDESVSETTTKKTTAEKPDVSETTTAPQTTTTVTQTAPPKTTTEKPQTTAATTKKTTTTTTTTTKKTTTAPPSAPEPSISDRETKASIVVNYAKSMVGGRYVWGGSNFGATDCSGLVMLSYAQIGISLPHLASAQASYGTNVSKSELIPGDLVFFGYSTYSSIYHVAIYIGNGRIVHAESSDTGIVISNLDTVARYNNITCMKRII